MRAEPADLLLRSHMDPSGSQSTAKRLPGVERTLRLLMRSKNRSAGYLLQIAMESEMAELRLGAVRAIARRAEPKGHASLVDAWPRLMDDARSALGESDTRTGFRRSLERLVRDPSAERRLNAARAALACNATDLLAPIVEGASSPDDPNATELAAIAHRLSTSLREQLDRHEAGGDRADKDPAFSRRAAVNQLAEALALYKRHRRPELLESLLILAPFNEPSLNRVLHNPNDPAHEEVVSLLSKSGSPGVNELLAGVLKDLTAPESLMRIAAQRSDEVSLGHMMRYLGYPIGARAAENAARLEEIAWVQSDRREVLLKLNDHAQAAAVQVAAASGVGKRRLMELLVMILERGKETGRLEACRAVGRLPTHLAREPLAIAVRDESSAVAATATKLLRKKKLPGATVQLVSLLDHEEDEVRGAAQDELPEISYSRYRDGYDAMPAEQRGAAGVLVAKGDRKAADSLATELTAGAPVRRLRALEMTEQMGMIAELTPAILDRVNDADTGVRAEAVRLLGEAPESEDVIQALRHALSDRSPAVVSAARESLGRFGFWNEEPGK